MKRYPPAHAPLKDRILRRIVKKENGCWEWQGPLLPTGYAQIGIGSRHEGKVRVHRAMFEIFKGPIPDELYVLHTCDNRCCVNPDHLFLGTAKDNTQDMLRKGRARGIRGSQNKSSKLTEENVLEIRSLLGQGAYHKNLAEIYGVATSTISRIAQGKKWTHVK